VNPPDLDDDSLHALLARGRLSGARRDRILERVVSETSGNRRGWRRAAVLGGVLLPVAAVIAVAIGTPWKARRGEADSGWLVPKGEPAGAMPGARCPDREPGQCRIGDRLIFEVDGATKGGFFAGYADCASGERVWYFPAKGQEAPALPAAAGHSVLRQAARIGEEHGVGRCLLHLFVLEHPVDRETLASGKVSGAASRVFPIDITRDER
jgi:hypothetical protein